VLTRRCVHYWCSGHEPDVARIDSLFRQSKLYRAKWERPDYRESTIDYATKHCKEFYQWRKPNTVESEHASGPSFADTSIVHEIEKAIKKQHYFARDQGDLLYHFADGVYKPSGERFLHYAVKRYCEQNAN
jgi:primase-polymerase (primpol)-like protein